MKGSLGTAASITYIGPPKKKRQTPAERVTVGWTPNGTIMHSRIKGYCSTCRHSIWLNEKIIYDGKAHHLDCSKALVDETPRRLDPNYLSTFGKIKKSELAKMIEAKKAAAAVSPNGTGY